MQKMRSLWQARTELPQFPKLEHNIRTDVLIIGGGMAGILCAFFLEQAGVDYILVEAGRICGGVTGNTTAKITSQHGFIYQKLLKEFGPHRAKQYFRANDEALEVYRTLCEKIPCGFETKDNYVYSTDDTQKLQKEMDALAKIGVAADLTQPPELNFPTVGAIRFARQAQFDPLQFINGIVDGLKIYEKSAIRSFDGQNYHTDRVQISANKTIVATHFPIWNKNGGYFLKLYQHRSYVLALEKGPQLEGMYVDGSGKGLSLRSYGDMLLLGGGAHRTGKQGGGWAKLEQVARTCYPGTQIRYRWATQDCMSLDGVPYIGRYSEKTPNVFVATGFNKWGMTSSMAAALLLRDMVQGKENPYQELFSPSRGILRSQLAVNGVETVCNFLSMRRPRCPHLGCALQWNAQERSWDCPCHGSRFEKNGKLLDGPAMGDLPEKE